MQKSIKFRELLSKLNDIADLRPEALDFDVIVAINSFDPDYGGCENLEEIDVDDNIKQVWLSSNC